MKTRVYRSESFTCPACGNRHSNEIDEIVLPDEDAVVARIFTDVKQGVEESNSKAEAAAKDELAEEKKIFSFAAEKPAEDLPTAQEAEDEFLRFMMEDGE